MTARLPPSRLLCRKALQNLTVRLIDAEAFRNQSLDHQEFGRFAIHDDFPDQIPESELWIDNLVPESEHRLILVNAYARIRAMKNGESPDNAYEYGDAVETSERRKTELGIRHEDQPDGLYLELWKIIEDE